MISRGRHPQRPQRVAPQVRGKHGLSAQDIARLEAAQGRRCALCGLGPDGEPWQVDHDHALAASHPHPDTEGCRRCVRGLLHRRCNSVLGFARDDPRLLRAAAEYLDRAAARRPG